MTFQFSNVKSSTLALIKIIIFIILINMDKLIENDNEKMIYFYLRNWLNKRKIHNWKICKSCNNNSDINTSFIQPNNQYKCKSNGRWSIQYT